VKSFVARIPNLPVDTLSLFVIVYPLQSRDTLLTTILMQTVPFNGDASNGAPVMLFWSVYSPLWSMIIQLVTGV
ncbi:MAG: hypothetical protein ACP5K4_06800, partial [Caldisericum sp.]